MARFQPKSHVLVLYNVLIIMTMIKKGWYAKYYNVHVIVGVKMYRGVLCMDSVFKLLARHCTLHNRQAKHSAVELPPPLGGSEQPAG
jgi:hypothetical protein